MHTRLLKGEQWRWYLNDVAKPLLIILVVVFLWRLVIPVEMSRLEILFHLTLISVSTFVIAILATPVTRSYVRHYWTHLKMTIDMFQ